MTDTRVLKNADITYEIIGAFYHVYNDLGFGYLEKVYQLAMEVELRRRGLRVAREASVRVHYEGMDLCGYKMDMLVNETVLVEIKSTQELHPVATRQAYNYLRATNLEVALLLHFGPKAKFHRLYCPNAVEATLPDLTGNDSDKDG